jgi:hypothetical protein
MKRAHARSAGPEAVAAAAVAVAASAEIVVVAAAVVAVTSAVAAVVVMTARLAGNIPRGITGDSLPLKRPRQTRHNAGGA